MDYSEIYFTGNFTKLDNNNEPLLNFPVKLYSDKKKNFIADLDLYFVKKIKFDLFLGKQFMNYADLTN